MTTTPAKTNVPARPASTPTTAPQRASLVRSFAEKLGVEPEKLMSTLKDTAFKQPRKDGQPGPEVTDAQMMALLVVANEYGLNPFTRDLYAFPAKSGGIVPIISIDGWVRIINQRPELSSIDFDYPPEGTEKADWYVGCTITRKDRATPMRVVEYYAECYRNTEPWDDMPRRMLRHKALIQCARIAFGYGGVYDPDEGEKVRDAIDSTATEVHGKPFTREPQAKQLEAPVALTIPQLLDKSGVPETELLAHFEVGTLAEITNSPTMDGQAREWLQKVNS